MLIAHLRSESEVSDLLLRLLADGHDLAVSCVTVAEIERLLRSGKELDRSSDAESSIRSCAS